MATIHEVIMGLKEDGYSLDFNLKNNCLVCQGNALELFPHDFVVDRHYRFEGNTDPADEAIVYAISSKKHHMKGVLVNGYGPSSDPVTDRMIAVLQMESPVKENQTITMEEKSNDATANRPAGGRLLQAGLLEMDLNQARKQIKEEPAWANSDRNAITLFKSDKLRIVVIGLHAGAELKTHTAPGIITVQVLEGGISFHAEERVVELTVGQMLTLVAGAPHSVVARQESVFLLTIAIQDNPETGHQE